MMRKAEIVPFIQQPKALMDGATPSKSSCFCLRISGVLAIKAGGC